MNSVRLMTADLLAAFANMAADAVIGEVDGRQMTAGQVGSYCTMPTPDGGQIPLLYVDVMECSDGGLKVEVLPVFLEEHKWFIVQPKSPAFETLRAAVEKAHEERQGRTLEELFHLDASRGWFRLRDGELVSLERLTVVHAYEGCLEGDPRVWSKWIIDRGPRTAQLMIARPCPVVVLPPPCIPLPRFLWVGVFDRGEPNNDQGDLMRSELGIAWYGETLVPDMGGMIQHAVERVDWDAVAEKYVYDP